MAHLELALIEAVLKNTPSFTAQSTPKSAPTVQKTSKKPTPSSEPVVAEKQPEPLVEAQDEDPAPAIASETEEPTSETSEQFDAETWNKALDIIKKTHNTLYSVARMANPTIDGDELTLTFGFAFHQKRLNETKNRQIISDVVQKVSGKPINITCVVAKATTKPQELRVEPSVVATTSQNDTISTISNIFGSAELLES
jgi:hypothetical protein